MDYGRRTVLDRSRIRCLISMYDGLPPLVVTHILWADRRLRTREPRNGDSNVERVRVIHRASTSFRVLEQPATARHAEHDGYVAVMLRMTSRQIRGPA